MADYKISLGTELRTNELDKQVKDYKGKINVGVNTDSIVKGINAALSGYKASPIEVGTTLNTQGITDKITSYSNKSNRKNIKVGIDPDFTGVNAKIEAYELYITLPPIEEFGMELYNYASYISQRFFDRKHGESKSVSKQEALKYIEELMKSETESERQRILNEDRTSTIISPYYIEYLEDLYNALVMIYQKDEEYVLNTCKEIIVPLLNEFTKLGDISAENEQIDIITIDNEIRAVISNNKIFGEGITTAPELFYNSFRYKLYCISVKIALAFMTMKFSNINAPLFFDDVFNASDFDNSVNIDKFFNIIYTSYEKLGIGKKTDLQIVLFTHDEVVLNGISQAIEEYGFNIGIKYIRGILQEAESLNENDLQDTPKGQAYLLYDKIN